MIYIVQTETALIETMNVCFYRKAVAKTSMVHNLAVYVAQDCTGEINRLD